MKGWWQLLTYAGPLEMGGMEEIAPPPDFSQIESEAWSVKQLCIFACPQIFSPSTTSFTEYI